MGLPNESTMVRANAVLVLLLKAAAAFLAAKFLYFLYEGLYWRRRFRQLKAQGVPMLEHSLIFGHLSIFQKLKEHFPTDASSFRVVFVLLLNNWREYFPNETECPPFLMLDMWPMMPPMVFVWDPEQVHKFTVEKPAARNSKYFMTPMTRGFDLLSVERPAHRQWRALFSAGFSQRKLVARIPAVLEEINIFANKVKHMAGANGAWGDVFQLEEPATSLTLDIIGRIALNVRIGGQLQEKNIFKDAMLGQVTKMTGPSLRADLRRLNPLWQYNAWKNHRAMDSVILPKIAEARGDKADSDITLVDMVLGDQKEQKSTGAPARDPELVKGLISNIKAFAFAGHDTTATTICWCFYNLGRHPSVLAKLQAEHEAVFGPDPQQMQDILTRSPQKINELPYTLAVIKETLRIYAIVHSFRKGDSSLELTSSRCRLNTEGVLVIVQETAMHLHPDLWYKAQEFIPERWLVSKDDPLYPPAHAWRPFEHGPMNCIGQELALIELKLVLVSLVREVEILPAWEKWDKLRGHTEAEKTTVDGQRAYPTNRGGGLMKPKDGIPVHVRLL